MKANIKVAQAARELAAKMQAALAGVEAWQDYSRIVIDTVRGCGGDVWLAYDDAGGNAHSWAKQDFHKVRQVRNSPVLSRELFDAIQAAPEFFRVSVNYIYWAHQPGADDAQPLACELMDLITAKHDYILVPYAKRYLIAEIASVAELYVGGRDTDIRAARVLKRARAVLAAIDARAARAAIDASALKVPA
jgi:hypothetical protein